MGFECVRLLTVMPDKAELQDVVNWMVDSDIDSICKLPQLGLADSSLVLGSSPEHGWK